MSNSSDDQQTLDKDGENLKTEKNGTQKDDEMTSMFASVWLKVEVEEGDEYPSEDNLDDIPYRPPGIMDRVGKKHSNSTRKRKPPTKKMQCDQCDYTTVYKNCFKIHMLSHSNEEPLQCSSCSYTTRYHKYLSRHILMRHDDYEKKCKLPKYKCPQCDYKTCFKSNLKSHMRKHITDKMYQCESCIFRTSYKHNYFKHLKSKHNREPVKFKCDKCPFITKYEGHITRHLAKIHNEVIEKGKQCEYCEYSNRIEWRLNIHKQKSKQKTIIKCISCDFETYYRCEIRMHNKIRHHKGLSRKLAYSYGIIDRNAETMDFSESSGANIHKNLDEDNSKDNINNLEDKVIGDSEDPVSASELESVKTEEAKSIDSIGTTDVNIHKDDKHPINMHYSGLESANYHYNDLSANAVLQYNRLGHIDTTERQYSDSQCIDLEYTDTQNVDGYSHTNGYTEQGNYQDMSSMLSSKDTLTKERRKWQRSSEKFTKYIKVDSYDEDRDVTITIESANKERMFQCKDCEYKSKFKASVQRHHQRQHTVKKHKPYKCMNCDFSTKTKEQVSLHNKRSYTEEAVNCITCGFTTNYKCQLVSHQKLHYTHRCTLCDYMCKQKHEIQRHYTICHSGAETKCRFCDFTSINKATVVCHETVHTGEKPFKCTICKFTCARKYVLDNHLIFCHGGVKKNIVFVTKSKIESLKVPINSDEDTDK